MPSWYWLLEPLTRGSRLYLPLPRQLYWFLGSYPKLSAVLLVAGLIAMFYRRNRQLWWFLVPILLSGGLHGLALTIGDAFPNFGAVLTLVTVGLGLVFAAYALVKARAAWPAGVVFTATCVTVLAYQGIVSIMMLTGSSI